ncbi:diguanylate cyclase [Cobetia marina]|uniref:Diguanylate cyclase n=1 Tax=Cobetia marina TaxID=28258 RepID=A0ABU9GGI7_COBMA
MMPSSFSAVPLPSGNAGHPHDSLLPEHLQALLALSLTPEPSHERHVEAHLDAGCRLLGMTTAILGHAESSRYEIMAAVNPPAGREVGGECPLEETWCSSVIAQAACVAHRHISAEEDTRAHAAYSCMPFESYVAAPLWSEGRLTGTLCFGDETPRQQDFTASERALVETLATALGQLLDVQRAKERTRSELDNLRLAYQKMEGLFSHCSLPMALMDFHGHWTRMNPAFSRLLGMEPKELTCSALEDISHPQDMLTCRQALSAMRTGDISEYRQPHRYLGRHGQMIDVMLELKVIDSRAGIILSQHEDISERRAHEASLTKLRHQLETRSPAAGRLPGSTLDKLMPFELIEQQLDNEIARSARHGQPLCILILSVDDLEDYTREYGHVAGERPLQQVASILRNASRKSDLLCMREDNSLMAILTSTDASGAIILAERVRHAAAELSGLDRPITCSVGLTGYHPAPDTMRLANRLELMDRAQQALKKAQRQGCNRVRFLDPDPVMPLDAGTLTTLPPKPAGTD